MVNTEEFTKRLSIIMEYYELSAAAFADKIEVGRSSISHLLSGRNKPSLDFVLKIIEAFPEVELYWLLNGKGSFPKKNQGAAISPASISEQELPRDLFSDNQVGPAKKTVSEIRRIKKVVIFYSDGSFEAYEN